MGIVAGPDGALWFTENYNNKIGRIAIAGDTVPPTITTTGNIVVDATSPIGATVDYQVTATDSGGPAVVVCDWGSHSTFPIGTTTVSCTATDGSGNQASASFTVTVRSPAEQLDNLISSVKDFNLQQGIGDSLDAKLQNALDALTAARSGATASACGKMDAFISEVQAQSGRTLTLDQANQLIAAANRIKATMSCP